MGRKKHKKILCTKTFYTYVGDDNLADNGINAENYKNNNYPIFEEGKTYRIIGPMESISGNTIAYIESDLILKWNSSKISEKFYVNEFREDKVREWEEHKKKIEAIKDTHHEFAKDMLEMLGDKPRQTPFISDYFDYNE